MKTLILNGSPRPNGDTARLIERILPLIPGEKKIVSAYRDDISPCVDCRYCWKNPGCAIEDAMQDVYRFIEGCDNVILASPVYFSSLTGKMLDLGSRFQTYFCSRFFRSTDPGIQPKKGGVILVGGGDGDADMAVRQAVTLLHQINCRNVAEPVIYHNTNEKPACEDSDTLDGIRRLAEYFSRR